MKKLIALSSRDCLAYERPAYFVQLAYMNALEKLGANYISVVPNESHDYDFIAQMCDGLLLCGGGDSNSKYYNQELHETADLVEDKVDEMDLKLLGAFLKAKKPVLGICRGHQIINIYYGGTLYQDIPSQYDTTINHRQKEARHVGTHTVTLTKDCELGKMGETYTVNTFHHQNIDKLGKSLEILAYSEDGLIEAIRNEDVLGVQWHPECMVEESFHRNVIQAFLDRIKG